MKPLEGIRVVEFGGYISGPSAGMVLGDLGADVIKVESPVGDAARNMGPYGDGIWRNFNRGKRSVVLNLEQQEGIQVARDLLGTADVLIQNLRPGAMDRLGLGAESVRTAKPGLIYVSISGYNPAGPSASRPGFDVAAQAESGMMSVTGERGGSPLRIGYPVVDIATGHVTAEAVLAALIGRGRSGEGATLNISMFEVAVHLQAVQISSFLALGEAPPRMGNGMPYNAPSADLVETLDGWIVVSAYQQDHWRRLCATIARPDLVADPRFATNEDRVEHRAEMLETLGAHFSLVTSEEATALLARSNIVAGVVRSYPALTSSEEWAMGNYPIDLPDEGERAVAIRAPYSFGTNQETARLPLLGEHSAALLEELGRSTTDIGRLVDSGVSRTP